VSSSRRVVPKHRIHAWLDGVDDQVDVDPHGGRPVPHRRVADVVLRLVGHETESTPLSLDMHASDDCEGGVRDVFGSSADCLPLRAALLTNR
jgi:hypothetical protein